MIAVQQIYFDGKQIIWTVSSLGALADHPVSDVLEGGPHLLAGGHDLLLGQDEPVAVGEREEKMPGSVHGDVNCLYVNLNSIVYVNLRKKR